MNSGDCTYIWHSQDWPHWRFDLTALAFPMAEASRAQGRLAGRLADVGFATRDEASLAALTEDVVKTSAIEGEALSAASVRSSIARRLGVDIGALAPVDRHVEGVVEMVLDATANCLSPVTRDRLFGWHAALFPTGYSGLARINIGQWRDDANGPMQVVSGAIGRQRVHFEAPPAHRLETEMAQLLDWIESASNIPPLIKAGLGHLWLVTLHPFNDGNGPSRAPSATCCWRVRRDVRSASTVCRRKSRVSERHTMQSWRRRKRAPWMSRNGCSGF